jgi:hypothetical protein
LSCPLRQATDGSGAVCGDDHLRVAKPGHKAPTGLDASDGIGAF